MAGLIVWRGVYLVPDQQVTMPPNGERRMHERRPVIVLSEQRICSDENWPVVSALPLSTSDKYVTPYDVEVAKGVCGNTDQCWARVHMVQPLLKEHLVTKWGEVPPNLFQDILSKFAEHVGLL